MDEKTIKELLNVLRYKCDDIEVAPFIAKAFEMIKRGYPCPTYEELKEERRKHNEPSSKRLNQRRPISKIR
ncbi:hypothetical protein [uncultured Mediterranean phage uvMED]|nr:hypothetical protein [uncultured Mediterranean phage uvMED]